MAIAAQRIAVAVVSSGDQFLIGLRPPGGPLDGFWEFPGGKLLAGETPAEAAARECLEETFLRVEAVGEYPRVEYSYAHGRLEIHFVKCRLIDPAAAREPAPRFRWVSRASLDTYTFPPANAELLAAIRSGQ